MGRFIYIYCLAPLLAAACGSTQRIEAPPPRESTLAEDAYKRAFQLWKQSEQAKIQGSPLERLEEVREALKSSITNDPQVPRYHCLYAEITNAMLTFAKSRDAGGTNITKTGAVDRKKIEALGAEVKKYANDALRRYPNWVPAWLVLGNRAIQDESWSEARESLTNALRFLERIEGYEDRDDEYWQQLASGVARPEFTIPSGARTMSPGDKGRFELIIKEIKEYLRWRIDTRSEAGLPGGSGPNLEIGDSQTRRLRAEILMAWNTYEYGEARLVRRTPENEASADFLKNLDSIADIDKNYFLPRYLQARHCDQIKDYGRAVALVGEYLNNKYPLIYSNPEYLLFGAELKRKIYISSHGEGDYTEALRLLGQIIGQFTDDAAARLCMAQIVFEHAVFTKDKAQFDLAEKTLEKLQSESQAALRDAIAQLKISMTGRRPENTKADASPAKAPVSNGSRVARDEFDGAFKAWIAAFSNFHPAQRAEMLEHVDAALKRAMDNDPNHPLFLCRYAANANDMAKLAIATSSSDKARIDRMEENVKSRARAAIERHPDWVPGFLILGDQAIRNNAWNEARKMLAEASRTLDRLDGFEEKGNEYWKRVASGAEKPDLSGDRKRENMDNEPGRGEFLHQIDEYLQWREDYRTDGQGASRFVSVNNTMNPRLRAEVAVAWAKLHLGEALAGTGGSEESASSINAFSKCASELDRAIALDSDYFEAKFLKAVCLERSLDYSKAVSLIEPYLKPVYPIIAHNPIYYIFVARLEARLYDTSRKDENYHLALALCGLTEASGAFQAAALLLHAKLKLSHSEAAKNPEEWDEGSAILTKLKSGDLDLSAEERSELDRMSSKYTIRPTKGTGKN
ncbi:MAG: tetratricopeptide repeat protein [Planctomycetes bacterium]|nr:tetratricopeptide repeat protein [Planctomycetota bacterium]